MQVISLFGCPKTIDITAFFEKCCITTRTKKAAPHGDAAFFSCCCRQIVPVTVKTAVPGVIVHSPVAASCV